MKSIFNFVTGAILWAGANLVTILPHGVAAVIASLGAVLGVLGIHQATTSGGPDLSFLGKGIKTVLGIIGAVTAYLLSPEAAGVLSANLSHLLEVLFTALTGLGLYHAGARAAAPSFPGGRAS